MPTLCSGPPARRRLPLLSFAFVVLALLTLLALRTLPSMHAQQIAIGPSGCICSISATHAASAEQEAVGLYVPPVEMSTMQNATDMIDGIPSLEQLQQSALLQLEALGGSSASMDQAQRQALFPQQRGGAILCNQFCYLPSVTPQSFANNSDFLTVTVGADMQICGIHADGYLVECIGPDDNTQIDYPPGLQALAVSSGSDATCALMLNYTLTCWGGLNSQGELDPPEQFVNGSMVVESLAMRNTAGCAIGHDARTMNFMNVTENTLLCWGLGAPSNFLGDGLIIPTLPPGSHWIQVVLSSSNAAGLWGLALDSQGQVWNLPFVQSGIAPTIVVESITNPSGFIRISMGDTVGCGILASSFAAVCWLTPFNGGALSPQDYGLIHIMPLVPPTLQLIAYEYTDIQCIASMCVGIASNLYNSLQVWGTPDPNGGQSVTNAALPYLPPLGNVRSVTLGYNFGCVLLSDGAQSCFTTDAADVPFDSIEQSLLFIGDAYTNTGNPFATISPYGVPLVPQFQFQSLGVSKGMSAAVGTYLLVLNDMAEIGNDWGSGGTVPPLESIPKGRYWPNSFGTNTAPVNFTQGATVSRAAPGLGFYVGLEQGGRVQVGNYQQEDQVNIVTSNSDPQASGTGADTRYLDAIAGQGFWCLQRLDRSVWCNNITVGLDTTISTADAELSTWIDLPQLNPSPSYRSTAFSTISAGDLSMCGIFQGNSTVRCYGSWTRYNFSTVSTYTVSLTRLPVGSLPLSLQAKQFESVSVGSRGACGVEAGTGRAFCWGMCDAGQCNVTLRADGSPFLFRSLEVGSDTVCGITRDETSTLVCWGGASTSSYTAGWPLPSIPPSLLCLSPVPSSTSLPSPLGSYSAGAEIRLCPQGVTSIAGGYQTPLCTGGCPAGGVARMSPLRANLQAGSAIVEAAVCGPPNASPPGTYSPGGALSPIPCSAGRFGSVPGLTTAACSGECVKGMWCGEGTMDATQNPCPPGRFGNSAGLASPACSGACDLGWYCLAGSRDPRAFVCPSRGFVCPAGSGAPQPVPDGYSSISSLSPALRNASGLTPEQGMTDYVPCLPGYSCQQGVATACTPGRAGGGNGSAICAECAFGSEAPTAGMTACTLCTPGRFASYQGEANCAPCEGGRAVATPGASSCFSCAPGRYSLGGQPECAQCPPQTFSPVAGSSTCATCTAPNIVSANSTVCAAPTPCDPGQYMVVLSETEASAGGSIPPSSAPVGSCSLCQPGTYSSAPGAIAACIVCPPQTYTLEAGSTQCQDCPSVGFDCQSIYGLGLPVSLQGYWSWVEKSSSPSGDDVVASRETWIVTAALCPTDYCAGGIIPLPPDLMNSSLWNQTGLPYALQAHLEAQDPCVGHRSASPDNALCGECEQGYVLWRDACVICDQVNWALLVGFILITLLLVLLLHVISQRSGTETKLLIFFVQSALLQLGSFDTWLSWLGILNLDLISASGNSCIAPFTPMQHVAVQLLLPLLLVVELGFILAIKNCTQRILGVRTVEEINAAATGEVVENSINGEANQDAVVERSRPPLRQVLVSKSLPASSPLTQSEVDDSAAAGGATTKSYELRQSLLSEENQEAAFGGVLEEDGKKSPDDSPADAEGLLESDLRAASALRARRPSDMTSVVSFSGSLARRLAAAVPTSSNAFARTLLSILLVSFQHTCSASLYLLECVSVKDQSVVFSQPDIDCNSTAYHRLFPALIVILVVAVLFTPLAMVAIILRNRKLLFCPAEHPTRGKAAVVFRARYGILYESYRPELPYWQCVVLLRQVLLVGLAVLFHQDHNMRYLAFSLFNCVALLLHVLCRPYAVREANLGETVSLQLLVFLSLILLSVQPPLSMPVQIILTMLVLPFSAVWTLYILYVRVRNARTVEVEPPSKRAFVNL